MSDVAPGGRRRIAIVGGGIAGLAAAWHLERERQAGRDVEWLLLESEARAGGKIWSERVEDCLIERGADSFVFDKPGMRELIEELELETDVLPIDSHAPRVYIARGNRLIPLPRGMYLALPTRLGPFLRSPLLSLRGRLRVLLEPFTRVPAQPGDESLAAFVTRHLGREALNRIAEPLMAGIHLADPDRLSMRAAFPAFVGMERQYGSLLWAARATARQADRRPLTRRTALRRGMGQLVETLTARLPATHLALGRPVERIHRTPGGWRIDTPDRESLEADGLVLAVPAPIAAKLLATATPQVARQLAEIHYAGSANMTLAYRTEDVPTHLDGSGFLVPRTETRTITACSFVSSKFPDRAPAGTVLLRVFFGGARDPHAAERDENELLAAARADLRALLGVTVEPRLTRLARFALGTPQYVVGHLDRVRSVEAACPPGLAVAGSALHGLGLPECVVSGRDAARKVLEA